MPSKKTSLALICLTVIRCAGPQAASSPAAASLPDPEEGALPTSFAASQAASQPHLTLQQGLERTQPRAALGRFMGRLWTPCPAPVVEAWGFAACLGREQVKEVFLRFGEDMGRAERAVIDAVEQRDKAIVREASALDARARAVLAGVLGALAALVAGTGFGILIGHFYVR